MKSEERTALIDELRLRFFYLVAEQSQVEKQLKQLGQELPTPPEAKKRRRKTAAKRDA